MTHVQKVLYCWQIPKYWRQVDYVIVKNLDNQHNSNRYAVHKDQHLAPSALQCLMFGAVQKTRVQGFKVIGAENSSHGPKLASA